MAEKDTETGKPSTTSGSELVREVDPNSPEHKDAGQVYVEREQETMDEQDKQRESERERKAQEQEQAIEDARKQK